MALTRNIWISCLAILEIIRMMASPHRKNSLWVPKILQICHPLPLTGFSSFSKNYLAWVMISIFQKLCLLSKYYSLFYFFLKFSFLKDKIVSLCIIQNLLMFSTKIALRPYVQTFKTQALSFRRSSSSTYSFFFAFVVVVCFFFFSVLLGTNTINRYKLARIKGLCVREKE